MGEENGDLMKSITSIVSRVQNWTQNQMRGRTIDFNTIMKL